MISSSSPEDSDSSPADLLFSRDGSEDFRAWRSKVVALCGGAAAARRPVPVMSLAKVGATAGVLCMAPSLKVSPKATKQGTVENFVVHLHGFTGKAREGPVGTAVKKKHRDYVECGEFGC